MELGIVRRRRPLPHSTLSHKRPHVHVWVMLLLVHARADLFCVCADGNQERCTISALQDIIVTATQYQIESYYDYVTIGGIRYRSSGSGRARTSHPHAGPLPHNHRD